MKRDELIARTRQLIAEGERLAAAPALAGLRTWLQLSDDLLSAAWGSMDRYHLAWLQVGRARDIVRGRRLTAAEEAAYVREVAVSNASGLHARPAATFVRTVARMDADVRIQNVTTNSLEVNAKSILGVLSIGVLRGHTVRLTVTADGDREPQLARELQTLIENGLEEVPGPP